MRRRTATWLLVLLCGCPASEQGATATSSTALVLAGPSSSVATSSSLAGAPLAAPPSAAVSATGDVAFPAVRSDEAIQMLATERCQRHPERPFLLDFGAPWCRDCRRLAELTKHAELERELSHWASLKINVGDFDQNTRLLAAFGVRAIAHWVALAPHDCAAPIDDWPRLGDRRVEPVTGGRGDANPQHLWQWLKTMRAKRK